MPMLPNLIKPTWILPPRARNLSPIARRVAGPSGAAANACNLLMPPDISCRILRNSPLSGRLASIRRACSALLQRLQAHRLYERYHLPGEDSGLLKSAVEQGGQAAGDPAVRICPVWRPGRALAHCRTSNWAVLPGVDLISRPISHPCLLVWIYCLKPEHLGYNLPIPKSRRD